MAVVSGEVPVTLDPEKTSFAFTRSIELHASGGNDSDLLLRGERIGNWTRWEFGEVIDQPTGCFVRDLLTRLELFDAAEGRFRVEQLQVQFKQYESFLNCTQTEVDDLSAQLGHYDNLWDCISVLKAFRQAILPSIDVFRQLFILDPSTSAVVYSSLGSSIRQPNQSVFEFCEKKFYHNKVDVWCAARNYSIPNDEDFHKHMDCIFNMLRYFNRKGDLDVTEICRDFHQVGVMHLDDGISEILRLCSVNPESKALSYYRCLLESDYLDQFKEALDYREIRSSDYWYALVNPESIYDRDQVQLQINTVNNEYCNN
ncbi:long form salivary protein D7L1-like isoform X2 [Ochlerotatus camptorhynchus]